jgi:hypothetical protein
MLLFFVHGYHILKRLFNLIRIMVLFSWSAEEVCWLGFKCSSFEIQFGCGTAATFFLWLCLLLSFIQEVH